MHTVCRPDIGIDVGPEKFAVLSTGEQIGSPRIGCKAERKLRIANRALARAKCGSKRRANTRKRLQRYHARFANTRATFLHLTSAALARRGGVVVKRLNINALRARTWPSPSTTHLGAASSVTSAARLKGPVADSGKAIQAISRRPIRGQRH